MDILRVSIWFLIGYLSITLLRLFHLYYLRNQYSKNIRPNLNKKELNRKIFRKNLFFMPFMYLAIWLTCSSFFFSHYSSNSIVLDGLIIGVSWFVVSIFLDFVILVFVKKYFQLSLKDVYMTTQPWISLSYYAVLISPLIFSFILQ
jgi:hypothetical protein